MKIIQGICIAILAALASACGGDGSLGGSASAKPAGVIDRFEIKSSLVSSARSIRSIPLMPALSTSAWRRPGPTVMSPMPPTW